MIKRIRNIFALIILLAGLSGLGYLVFQRLNQQESPESREEQSGPVAVEVAPILSGIIREKRVFSGSLEPSVTLTVAPKVAGQIKTLPFDLADTISDTNIVATLDDSEQQQALAQAIAELAVANARLSETQEAANNAANEFDRVETLHARGIAADAALDEARVTKLTTAAAVNVVKAEVQRAEAAKKAAEVRLGYATIDVSWPEEMGDRVVAQRFVERGDTVAPNTPILSIIDIDPILAVIQVTERDYADLRTGLSVTLTTDAYPDRSWTGEISRVAPSFGEGSRQARVEITIENRDLSLKPGMFTRVETILREAVDANIVPADALATRDGLDVLFLVENSDTTARMVAVDVGIRDSEFVEITSPEISGRVVTLGQQLLSEASEIIIAAERDPPASELRTADAANLSDESETP